MELPNYYSGLAQVLVSASAKGDLERVSACLKAGADVHYETDLPLRSAAFTGNLESMKLLVEHGADIHAGNGEALLYAGKRRDIPMMKYLIEKGADMAVVAEHHAKEIDDVYRETVDMLQSEKLVEAFEQRTQALKNTGASTKLRFRKPF